MEFRYLFFLNKFFQIIKIIKIKIIIRIITLERIRSIKSCFSSSGCLSACNCFFLCLSLSLMFSLLLNVVVREKISLVSSVGAVWLVEYFFSIFSITIFLKNYEIKLYNKLIFNNFFLIFL